MRHTDSLLLASVVALWVVLLVDLALTLRILRWHGEMRERQQRAERLADIETLKAGEVAPPFRARTLAGERLEDRDVRGTRTVFAFVSPQCGTCAANLPGLLDLRAQLRDAGVADLVLVSDSPPARTWEWLDGLGVEPRLAEAAVAVAPPEHSDLMPRYNPRGLLPYFCAVDETFTVLGQGPLGAAEWERVLAELSSLR